MKPQLTATFVVSLLLLSVMFNVYTMFYYAPSGDPPLMSSSMLRQNAEHEGQVRDASGLLERLESINAASNSQQGLVPERHVEFAAERFDHIVVEPGTSTFGKGTRSVFIHGKRYIWSIADNAVFTDSHSRPEYVGELVHGTLVPFSTERNRMVTVEEQQYLMNTDNGSHALFTTDDDPTYVGRLIDGVITRPEVTE